MAAHFSLTTRSPANIRPHLPPPNRSFPFSQKTPKQSNETCTRNQRNQKKIRVSNGESYLEMWKDAMERERKEVEFQTIVNNSSAAAAAAATEEEDNGPEVLERKSDQFKKILEVPTEERDKVQRLQVIDRAAAAIAAAQALLKENPPPAKAGAGAKDANINSNASSSLQGAEDGGSFVNKSTISRYGTPGPDFWSWSPPPDSKGNLEETTKLQISQKPSSYSSGVSSLIEKEQAVNTLLLPFESTLFEGSHNPPLPPLQSLMEVKKVNAPSPDLPTSAEECELEVLFSTHATEAVDALQKVGEASSHGMNVDGSKWWKETGTEERPDGVVCKWTLTRGVSSDGDVEWEEKYWEAADQFDYKELGSEKSGRDAEGNVWHEYWKEAMWQDFKSGLVHIEKTADKWGKKTGMGDEWQEKWWEHYDASGQAEKWAHKWCCINPDTPLEAGHAHVWHERWGEKYDGQGSSMKYTDKWAERSEGDGWTKWGDKWDENFDAYGHGVKQGEKWWQGKYGEQWNRTWGERHNGSGWVHKYGKSSSGEHWDTHVQQDTWYERLPHYGFELCFKNSVQLRQVQNPPEVS